ncbi:hypothetical protein BGW80DRAFT_817599 [Lactifluus volemus]|nr:hypothetical protein BGW80DRAFT_817599 [Lactifluus volemus]
MQHAQSSGPNPLCCSVSPLVLSAVPLISYRCLQYQKCVRLDEHTFSSCSYLILGNSRVRSHHRVCSYRTFSPLPLKQFRFIDRNVSTRSTIGMFNPLCEVQSDKASVDITSPYEGTLKEILLQGQVVKIGEGLRIIKVDEEASDPSDVLVTESPNSDASPTTSAFTPQERVVSEATDCVGKATSSSSFASNRSE